MSPNCTTGTRSCDKGKGETLCVATANGTHGCAAPRVNASASWTPVPATGYSSCNAEEVRPD